MRRVVATQETFRFDAFSQTAGPPRGPVCIACRVQDGELVLKQWDHQVEQWILRLQLVGSNIWWSFP